MPSGRYQDWLTRVESSVNSSVCRPLLEHKLPAGYCTRSTLAYQVLVELIEGFVWSVFGRGGEAGAVCADSVTPR
jgi:hypothetical protein